jgi:hypothetical protein
MRRYRLWLVLAAGLASLSCGRNGGVVDQDAGSEVRADSRTYDAGASTVWTTEATEMTAEIRGPGFLPAPPGSECGILIPFPTLEKDTYTLTVADHKLAWRFCKGSADFTIPRKWAQGQRVLNGALLTM